MSDTPSIKSGSSQRRRIRNPSQTKFDLERESVHVDSPQNHSSHENEDFTDRKSQEFIEEISTRDPIVNIGDQTL